MPNKCYAYLFNAEPSTLVFLKTYRTEFDEIVITFTDQNGRTINMDQYGSIRINMGFCHS